MEPVTTAPAGRRAARSARIASHSMPQKPAAAKPDDSAATTQPAIGLPPAGAIPFPLIVPAAPALPEAARTQPAASQFRAHAPSVANSDRRAVATTTAGVGQPVPTPSGKATGTPQPEVPAMTSEVPTGVAASPPSGVAFVARATRPIAALTPQPEPAEAAAPIAKADTVTTTVAAGASAAPDLLPLRATARQILAAPGATTDAPHASETETTVRRPLAEPASNAGQPLAPAAHGSERAIATAAPALSAPLSTAQAAVLIETIQMLRSEAKSDAMTLAIDHDELGKITMRFDRTDHGVAVRIDSPDPSVTQLIASSAPALRANGDSVGMRFERQDAAGGGAGGSRDAPRQGAGQDRNPTSYAQSSRPPAGARRDGLFA
jgi:hypothetical protein